MDILVAGRDMFYTILVRNNGLEVGNFSCGSGGYNDGLTAS